MRTATLSPSIEKLLAKHADFVAGTVMTILTACAIIFPRAIPFFYFALTIMAVVELWRTGNISNILKPPTFIGIFPGLLASWCFFTIFWSQDPMQALSKVSFLASIIIALLVVSSWLASISPSMSMRLKTGLLTGILIGALYLSVEIYFDQAIKIGVLNLVDHAATGSQKHFKVLNNKIERIPLYLLNRNVATLAILFWPSILLAMGLWKGKSRWFVLAPIVTMTGIATYGSEHDTSQIALMVSALLFGLTYFLPRIGLISVKLIWVGAILLVIPLAVAAYDAQLYKADWLPYSARARIIIWSYTAHDYLKHPIIGVGALSTQVASDTIEISEDKPADHVLPPQTARHGHNIFLQSWYELGAIGALLLLATGLAIIAHINRMADRVKPYAIATFGVALVLAAFTWGMWQVWYIAMFVFAMSAMQIVAHETSKETVQ